MGKHWKQWVTLFSWAPKSLPMVTRVHIKKQRHDLANKGPSSQGYVFSNSHVWMWELDYKESWVPVNWCFWTVVLEKTLESPLDCKRCNQSILKEISPGCSLEGLMMKLKLQYFGHLMGRADSLEKTWYWKRLKAGGEGDNRGWDGWMASPTRWTWVWASSRLGFGQGSLAFCIPWGRKESDMTERWN